VDVTSGFITILNTKIDKPKVIPIYSQLKLILEQAMEQSRSKLVFPDSKWKLLNKNKFRYKIRNICDKVGIEKSTPHELRHTFASRQS
jgi:integrase